MESIVKDYNAHPPDVDGMNFMLKKWILCVTLLCQSMICAAAVNKVIVFGDSLSDNGNLYAYLQQQLPVSPPYFKGRFSNGPVWVESLVQTAFGSDSQGYLLDYAFGGAGVTEDEDAIFSLRNQLNSYFSTHEKADPESLYIIWIGANNYLAMPDNEEAEILEVNTGIERALDNLVAKGAKKILVMNLPNLGRIPAARDLDEVTRFEAISRKSNMELERRFNQLKVRYPSVRWVYFDVFTKLDNMLDDPSQYGFKNVAETCYEAASDSFLAAPSELTLVADVKQRVDNHACDGYLFFDPVHPTGNAHHIMAREVRQFLEDSGIHF